MKSRYHLYSILAWFCLCAWPLLGTDALEAAERLPEYSVKALFLYNFIKFTEWPGSPRKDLSLCLLGGDPFGEALDSVDGKTAHGLPVRVRRDVTIEQTRSCALLFINEPDHPKLLRILRMLEGSPVLTVAEHEGFVRAGGMIGLTIAENRVRFDINVKATERGHLKISAQLLKLAGQVTE